MDCAAPTLERRHRQILLFAKLLHRIITAIEPLYQFTPLLNSLSCSPCTHCLTPLLLGTKTLGNVAAFLNTVAHRALTFTGLNPTSLIKKAGLNIAGDLVSQLNDVNGLAECLSLPQALTAGLLSTLPLPAADDLIKNGVVPGVAGAIDALGQSLSGDVAKSIGEQFES